MPDIKFKTTIEPLYVPRSPSRDVRRLFDLSSRVEKSPVKKPVTHKKRKRG